MAEEPKLGPNRGNAGKGRPKGVPNKTTQQLKDAILAAYDKAGGVDYLHRVATTDPRTFCTLLGKILPTQISGDEDSPVQHVHVIRREIVKRENA